MRNSGTIMTKQRFLDSLMRWQLKKWIVCRNKWWIKIICFLKLWDKLFFIIPYIFQTTVFVFIIFKYVSIDDIFFLYGLPQGFRFFFFFMGGRKLKSKVRSNSTFSFSFEIEYTPVALKRNFKIDQLQQKRIIIIIHEN